MTAASSPRRAAITLRYTHTVAEQLHACRVYQRSTRKHLVYKGLALLAIFGAIATLLGGGAQAGAYLLLALGIFAWFDPLPLALVWMTFRSSPALRQPYEATFDARGTHFKFGGSTISRPWERYQRVLESSQVFVLVYGRWTYSVVPRRALATPADAEAFRELLHRHIRQSGAKA